jgi:hypothetical protein
MINRFMISVAAAALIAGTGFANAQGMGREGGGSSGSSMQQSAPSSERGNSAASERGGSGSAAPMNRDAGNSSDSKSTQSEEKSPAGAKNQRAQDNNMQGQKPGSKSSDNATKDSTTKGGKDMKAEGRGNADDSRNAEKNADSKNGADQKGGAEQKSATDSRSQTTVGQAGAGAKLSSEQRTKITTVIKNQHVSPVTNVNFSISVGTRVPRDVSFRPLPAEVVTIYPEWRGYNFVLVREQIIVIDPETFEIVAVIDA